MNVEIKKLRMSLTRVAQAVGMEPSDFPPVIGLESFAIDHLVRATDQERGWNALAARIVGKIEDERAERLYALRNVTDSLEQLITSFSGKEDASCKF